MSSPSPALAEKVVSIRQINTGRFAHTITQEDLAELARLGRESNDAEASYEEKEEWVKAALRAGAQIEPGFFNVRLSRKKGGGYFMKPWETDVLSLT